LIVSYLKPSPHVLELEISFALVENFCVHCTKKGLCFLSMIRHKNFKKLIFILLKQMDMLKEKKTFAKLK